MLRQLDELPTLVIARLQVDAARFNQVLLLTFSPAHGFLGWQDWCLDRLLVISRFHVLVSSDARNFWVLVDCRAELHHWHGNLQLGLVGRLSYLGGGGHGDELFEDHTISHIRLSGHGVRLIAFGDGVI